MIRWFRGILPAIRAVNELAEMALVDDAQILLLFISGFGGVMVETLIARVA